MRKALLSAGCCLLLLWSSAQVKTIDITKDDVNVAGLFQTVNGEPFVGFKFVRLVEGSPFFSDEWMSGVLWLHKGAQCRGKMKLDLYTHHLLYLDAAGNEFVANMPGMKQVVLQSSDSIYSFLHASALPAHELPKGVTWYLQLYRGDSVQLYHYIAKQLQEHKPFNSATVEQTLHNKTGYVLVHRGQALAFQKPKDLSAFWPAYQKATEEQPKKGSAKEEAGKRAMAFAAWLDAQLKQSR